ncbi:hypothetical protein V6259_18885 [Marinomonas sp. TI.3.20]|uniref:hypothetical protein n=1 Tax=Marinomonas sp. TI.3.20 TaxID=3121296 RepID=UPI00311D87A2
MDLMHFSNFDGTNVYLHSTTVDGRPSYIATPENKISFSDNELVVLDHYGFSWCAPGKMMQPTNIPFKQLDEQMRSEAQITTKRAETIIEKASFQLELNAISVTLDDNTLYGSLQTKKHDNNLTSYRINFDLDEDAEAVGNILSEELSGVAQRGSSVVVAASNLTPIDLAKLISNDGQLIHTLATEKPLQKLPANLQPAEIAFQEYERKSNLIVSPIDNQTSFNTETKLYIANELRNSGAIKTVDIGGLKKECYVVPNALINDSHKQHFQLDRASQIKAFESHLHELTGAAPLQLLRNPSNNGFVVVGDGDCKSIVGRLGGFARNDLKLKNGNTKDFEQAPASYGFPAKAFSSVKRELRQLLEEGTTVDTHPHAYEKASYSTSTLESLTDSGNYYKSHVPNIERAVQLFGGQLSGSVPFARAIEGEVAKFSKYFAMGQLKLENFENGVGGSLLMKKKALGEAGNDVFVSIYDNDGTHVLAVNAHNGGSSLGSVVGVAIAGRQYRQDSELEMNGYFNGENVDLLKLRSSLEIEKINLKNAEDRLVREEQLRQEVGDLLVTKSSAFDAMSGVERPPYEFLRKQVPFEVERNLPNLKMTFDHNKETLVAKISKISSTDPTLDNEFASTQSLTRLQTMSGSSNKKFEAKLPINPTGLGAGTTGVYSIGEIPSEVDRVVLTEGITDIHTVEGFYSEADERVLHLAYLSAQELPNTVQVLHDKYGPDIEYNFVLDNDIYKPNSGNVGRLYGIEAITYLLNHDVDPESIGTHYLDIGKQIDEVSEFGAYKDPGDALTKSNRQLVYKERLARLSVNNDSPEGWLKPENLTVYGAKAPLNADLGLVIDEEMTKEEIRSSSPLLLDMMRNEVAKNGKVVISRDTAEVVSKEMLKIKLKENKLDLTTLKKPSDLYLKDLDLFPSPVLVSDNIVDGDGKRVSVNHPLFKAMGLKHSNSLLAVQQQPTGILSTSPKLDSIRILTGKHGGSLVTSHGRTVEAPMPDTGYEIGESIPVLVDGNRQIQVGDPLTIKENVATVRAQLANSNETAYVTLQLQDGRSIESDSSIIKQLGLKDANVMLAKNGALLGYDGSPVLMNGQELSMRNIKGNNLITDGSDKPLLFGPKMEVNLQIGGYLAQNGKFVSAVIAAVKSEYDKHIKDGYEHNDALFLTKDFVEDMRNAINNRDGGIYGARQIDAIDRYIDDELSHNEAAKNSTKKMYPRHTIVGALDNEKDFFKYVTSELENKLIQVNQKEQKTVVLDESNPDNMEFVSSDNVLLKPVAKIVDRNKQVFFKHATMDDVAIRVQSIDPAENAGKSYAISFVGPSGETLSEKSDLKVSAEHLNQPAIQSMIYLDSNLCGKDPDLINVSKFDPKEALAELAKNHAAKTMAKATDETKMLMIKKAQDRMQQSVNKRLESSIEQTMIDTRKGASGLQTGPYVQELISNIKPGFDDGILRKPTFTVVDYLAKRGGTNTNLEEYLSTVERYEMQISEAKDNQYGESEELVKARVALISAEMNKYIQEASSAGYADDTNPLAHHTSNKGREKKSYGIMPNDLTFVMQRKNDSGSSNIYPDKAVAYARMGNIMEDIGNNLTVNYKLGGDNIAMTNKAGAMSHFSPKRQWIGLTVGLDEAESEQWNKNYIIGSDRAKDNEARIHSMTIQRGLKDFFSMCNHDSLSGSPIQAYLMRDPFNNQKIYGSSGDSRHCYVVNDIRINEMFPTAKERGQYKDANRFAIMINDFLIQRGFEPKQDSIKVEYYLPQTYKYKTHEALKQAIDTQEKTRCLGVSVDSKYVDAINTLLHSKNLLSILEYKWINEKKDSLNPYETFEGKNVKSSEVWNNIIDRIDSVPVYERAGPNQYVEVQSPQKEASLNTNEVSYDGSVMQHMTDFMLEARKAQMIKDRQESAELVLANPTSNNPKY